MISRLHIRRLEYKIVTRGNEMPTIYLNGPAGQMDNPTILTSLIIGTVLLVLFVAACCYLFRRTLPRIYVAAFSLLLVLSWIFDLKFLIYVSGILLICGVVFFLVANINENREFTGNNMLAKEGKNRKRLRNRPEALFDREAVYKKVESAVITLSRQKVGALITFEKRDSLDSVMKSGSRIDAPVTAELLQTIFYPGTRLHDGAVVIRNDKIVAASVFFTPTTRPLPGKYGSRHRAAIGISEICDAVTVVVSEETGRVSIAYEGEIQPVGPDNFLETFEYYMSLVKEKADS